MDPVDQLRHLSQGFDGHEPGGNFSGRGSAVSRILGRYCATLAVSSLAYVVSAESARAQAYDQYIPMTVPGYDQARGAEIPERPRTEYDPLGIHLGNFTIQPRLNETLSYDSNVLGTQPSTGSAVIRTAIQTDVNSTGQGSVIGGSFGVSDNRYLDLPSQDFTDYNISLGGSHEFGQDKLTLAGSEAYLHQLATDIDSSAVNQPVGYYATDLRAAYDTSYLRWHFEPNLEYLGYRFDSTSSANGAFDQKVLDRNTYSGSLTVRFGDFIERSLQATFRAVETQYTDIPAGEPSQNSLGYEALFGFNYTVSGNLKALLLVGYELRTFTSDTIPSRASPVAEGSVVWTPTGLTTLIARVSRSVESSVGDTTTGVTLTQGSFEIQHELRRNILLQGHASIERADYNIGNPRQTLYNVGGSVSYLLNRNLRLTTDYEFNSLSTANGTSDQQTVAEVSNLAFTQNATGSKYNRHVISIAVQFAL
jgi:hypothetical protein